MLDSLIGNHAATEFFNARAGDGLVIAMYELPVKLSKTAPGSVTPLFMFSPRASASHCQVTCVLCGLLLERATCGRVPMCVVD